MSLEPLVDGRSRAESECGVEVVASRRRLRQNKNTSWILLATAVGSERGDINVLVAGGGLAGEKEFIKLNARRNVYGQ